jgi:hypothetical protein
VCPQYLEAHLDAAYTQKLSSWTGTEVVLRREVPPPGVASLYVLLPTQVFGDGLYKWIMEHHLTGQYDADVITVAVVTELGGFNYANEFDHRVCR